VLLNFPNNPSGYTPTEAEMENITHVLKEAAESGNKLVVICDDSYFGLIFDTTAARESLFAKLAGAHENLLAIKADGITKEEYAWGLRVGFVTYAVKNGTKEVYKALEGKTAGAVRGNISNSPQASQSAFLRALNSEAHEKEKEKNIEKIRERYVKVKEVLSAHPEYNTFFYAYPYNSGYFMCVQLKNSDPDKVWQLLLDKYSTGVICYSDISVLRLAFASTPADKIEKLFNNIYSACKDCVER
jgi:aspartate/methionine/tyrosine aminotransferase